SRSDEVLASARLKPSRSTPRSAPRPRPSLRRSRRFTLEGLDERDQRALVGVVQARLLGEEIRSEIVPLVDDEVRALAQLQQLLDDGVVREDVAPGVQLVLHLVGEIRQLFQPSLALLDRRVEREQIEVRDQADRRAGRNVRQLDAVVAHEHWEEALTEALK